MKASLILGFVLFTCFATGLWLAGGEQWPAYTLGWGASFLASYILHQYNEDEL